MLGDITAGPAFRFTQWLQLVRKRTAKYRSSGFPHRTSTTMPSSSWLVTYCYLLPFSFIAASVKLVVVVRKAFVANAHNLCPASENRWRIQNWTCILIRQKLACGRGLGRLQCWTLNLAPFPGTCSLHCTTLNTAVAMNIPRMR